MEKKVTNENFQIYNNYLKEYYYLKNNIRSRFNVFNITIKYIILMVLIPLVSIIDVVFLNIYSILIPYVLLINVIYMVLSNTNEKRIKRKLKRKYSNIDVSMNVEEISMMLNDYITDLKQTERKSHKKIITPPPEEFVKLSEQIISHDEDDFTLIEFDDIKSLKKALRNDQ